MTPQPKRNILRYLVVSLCFSLLAPNIAATNGNNGKNSRADIFGYSDKRTSKTFSGEISLPPFVKVLTGSIKSNQSKAVIKIDDKTECYYRPHTKHFGPMSILKFAGCNNGHKKNFISVSRKISFDIYGGKNCKIHAELRVRKKKKKHDHNPPGHGNGGDGVSFPDANEGDLLQFDGQEWIAVAADFLKGEQGEQGPQGPMGIQGIPGPIGPQGLQGLKGDKGDKGDQGVAGPAGPMGPAGAQGLKGDKGEQGVAGPMGPAGAQGIKGDKGDQGVAGPAGPMGPAGAQGIKGDKGDQGVAGPAGPIGPAGAQGLKGDKGDQGVAGPIGPAGAQGLKGDKGDQGVAGPIGPAGAQGLKGDKGDQGVAGPVGPAGAQGLKGDKGDQGVAGPIGPAGPQGLAGPVGPQGPKGDDASISLLAGTGILPGSGASGEILNNNTVAVDVGEGAGQIPQLDENGKVSLNVLPDEVKGLRVAYIKDIKANGIHGGDCFANSWMTRDLNTVSGDTGFVSLLGNQFALEEGEYDIHVIAPTYLDNIHKAILQNITDSKVEIVGTAGRSHVTVGGVNSSIITGRISVVGVTVFEVQHRCSASKSITGFGLAANFGVDEVYTQVKISKVK